MNRPLVVVGATDPLTEAGLVNHLRTRTEVRLATGARQAPAEVALFAADRASSAAVELMRAAAKAPEEPAVLVANRFDDDLDALAGCGVARLLLRPTAGVDDLVGALLEVAAAGGGGTRLPAPAAAHPNGSLLSAREIEVLRLVSDGWDTAAIAEKLSCSERTVQNIISGITGRLDARNRAHAVARALRTGLI